MPPHLCFLCGSMGGFKFPSTTKIPEETSDVVNSSTEKSRRELWLESLGLGEKDIPQVSDVWICARHFSPDCVINGKLDPSATPTITIVPMSIDLDSSGSEASDIEMKGESESEEEEEESDEEEEKGRDSEEEEEDVDSDTEFDPTTSGGSKRSARFRNTTWKGKDSLRDSLGLDVLVDSAIRKSNRLGDLKIDRTRCAVEGCEGRRDRYQNWKVTICNEHYPLTHAMCSCIYSGKIVKLFRFPKKEDPSHTFWCELVGIKNPGYAPTQRYRVCDDHFPSGAKAIAGVELPIFNLSRPWGEVEEILSRLERRKMKLALPLTVSDDNPEESEIVACILQGFKMDRPMVLPAIEDDDEIVLPISSSGRSRGVSGYKRRRTKRDDEDADYVPDNDIGRGRGSRGGRGRVASAQGRNRQQKRPHILKQKRSPQRNGYREILNATDSKGKRLQFAVYPPKFHHLNSNWRPNMKNKSWLKQVETYVFSEKDIGSSTVPSTNKPDNVIRTKVCAHCNQRGSVEWLKWHLKQIVHSDGSKLLFTSNLLYQLETYVLSHAEMIGIRHCIGCEKTLDGLEDMIHHLIEDPPLLKKVSVESDDFCPVMRELLIGYRRRGVFYPLYCPCCAFCCTTLDSFQNHAILSQCSLDTSPLWKRLSGGARMSPIPRIAHLRTSFSAYLISDASNVNKATKVLSDNPTRYLSRMDRAALLSDNRTCQHCFKTFPNVELVQRHYIEVASAISITDRRKNPMLNAQTMNMRVANQWTALSEEGQTFVCLLCDKIFGGAANLYLHLRKLYSTIKNGDLLEKAVPRCQKLNLQPPYDCKRCHLCFGNSFESFRFHLIISFCNAPYNNLGLWSTPVGIKTASTKEGKAQSSTSMLVSLEDLNLNPSSSAAPKIVKKPKSIVRTVDTVVAAAVAQTNTKLLEAPSGIRMVASSVSELGPVSTYPSSSGGSGVPESLTIKLNPGQKISVVDQQKTSTPTTLKQLRQLPPARSSNSQFHAYAYSSPFSPSFPIGPFPPGGVSVAQPFAQPFPTFVDASIRTPVQPLLGTEVKVEAEDSTSTVLTTSNATATAVIKGSETPLDASFFLSNCTPDSDAPPSAPNTSLSPSTSTVEKELQTSVQDREDSGIAITEQSVESAEADESKEEGPLQIDEQDYMTSNKMEDVAPKPSPTKGTDGIITESQHSLKETPGADTTPSSDRTSDSRPSTTPSLKVNQLPQVFVHLNRGQKVRIIDPSGRSLASPFVPGTPRIQKVESSLLPLHQRVFRKVTKDLEEKVNCGGGLPATSLSLVKHPTPLNNQRI